MCRRLSTRNISSKSMHEFLSNLANRQTDRQTNEHWQKHLPPPLSKVINELELLESVSGRTDEQREKQGAYWNRMLTSSHVGLSKLSGAEFHTDKTIKLNKDGA